MEAWTDLATALDESSVYVGRPRSGSANFKLGSSQLSSSKLVKNKGFTRRRTKSTGNLIDINIGESSSTEGEMDEYQEQAQSSLQQTETDDGSVKEKMNQQAPSFVVPSPVIANIDHQSSWSKETGVKVPGQVVNVAESDSVNETISTMRPHTRRKRRFKRMAVDPEPVIQTTLAAPHVLQHPQPMHKSFSFSTFASSSIFSKPRQKKIKKKPISLQKIPNIVIGKRKRSVRERSIECELEKISLNSSPEAEMAGKMAAAGRAVLTPGDNDSMDLDMKQLEQISSSSVSGSESDPGFYTYDDGREADDEQSDWYQESGPTWGVAKPWWEKEGASAQFRLRTQSFEDDLQAEEEDEEDTENYGEKKLQQILKGSWTPSAEEAKDAYKLRMQKLRDRIPGREIRAGRRHLGAQRGPSFSVLTSANEKLSRFLQDPAQIELRLHPMQKSERDQLSRLASLYSLQMLSEGARGLKCPVLKKTSNTMQAVRIDMDRSPSLWSDFKRQKKTPPASIASESTLEEQPQADENFPMNQTSSSLETCILNNNSDSPSRTFQPSGDDSNENSREASSQMPSVTITQ